MARPAQAVATMPIIDTHIHLFDPTRPRGVPWPNKDDAILYRPALPERYRKIAEPFGITGAIEVEASPWLEDNQGSWILPLRTRLLLGPSGIWNPVIRTSASSWNAFTETRCFAAFDMATFGAEISAQSS
jgi:hypothetical protein